MRPNVPWVELKKYPFHQDERASCPLYLSEKSFKEVESEMADIREEFAHLGVSDVRFNSHFKSHGYGAYTTWWTLEGWYDE
jgi:hypothetical protein